MPKGQRGVYRYPDAENEVHWCACGCGKQITFSFRYRTTGYPQYLRGHGAKGKTAATHPHIAIVAEKNRGRVGWNKGLTKADHPSLMAASEKLRGRPTWIKGLTKETSPSVAAQAEKMRGRTKYNDLGYAAMVEKKRGKPPAASGWNKGLTKVDHPSIAVQGKKTSVKLRGRTAANTPSVATGADKKRGRTKANHLGVAAMADKLRGRTAATHSGYAAMAEKRRGDKGSNWQGGISFEPYDMTFTDVLKESIRQRDNRLCQECGCPECECLRLLDVHHISYNKKDSSPSNLISLCHSCHNKTGRNRSYWTKHFQRKMRWRKFTHSVKILVNTFS